jgi:hypothetical protein
MRDNNKIKIKANQGALMFEKPTVGVKLDIEEVIITGKNSVRPEN